MGARQRRLALIIRCRRAAVKSLTAMMLVKLAPDS